jgi:hypothetical protein
MKGVYADFDVEIPAGYLFNVVIITHNIGSSKNPATVTIGSSLGGTDYIDAEGGQILYSLNPNGTVKRWSYTFNDGLKSTTSVGRTYVHVSGAGIKLDITMIYQLIP